MASHRNGSPIKLPRAQDEVVMLAFDQRNCRLVELHIFTGQTAQAAPPSQTATIRRLVKPPRWQFPPGWSSSRLGGRRFKSDRQSSKRQRPRRRTLVSALHRFHETQTNIDHAAAKPEIVDADQQSRTCENLRAASGLRGQSFMRILDVGMDDGLAYYVTGLNDGEFVQEYVRRRGALPVVTSLALVKHLLQDLVKIDASLHLHSTLCVERVLVTSQEEEYLQLRLFDYGLSQPAPPASALGVSRLVGETCRLLFLLLTGQPYSSGNPEDFSTIAELPANLRFVIKSVLTTRPADVSITLKSLRDEIREAMCSYATLVQARNPKMLLVADISTLPISHLQTLLLGDIPLKNLFGESFRIQNPELSGRHAFTLPAVNVSADQSVTLHLLPPERIVNQPDFMALPPQVWRQDPSKQINLLHMLNLWKGPDWAFLSEVREPGMSLSALMAKRGTLNPGEVVTLLRQIHSGLEQALETGVHRVDLDPSNIQLCVGYDGPVLPRDLERLHLKRLDAWPKFVVKLRLHKTMRSLCKPRLIDLGPWATPIGEELTVIAAREERHRAFICLAAYLLTGEGQMREIAKLPSSMPETAAGFVLDSLQRALSSSPVPSPPDFTEKLSHLLTTASAEMDRLEDPLAAQPPLAQQETESGGFVSDFEEDRPSEEAPVDHPRKTLLLAPVSHDLQSLDFHRPSPPRFRFPWLALAATAVLLGALAWMIFGDFTESTSGLFVSSSQPPAQTPAPISEEMAPALSKPPAHPPSQPQPVIHKTPVLALEPAPAPPQPPQALAANVSAPALPKESPPPPAPATPEAAATPRTMVASAPEPQLAAPEVAPRMAPPPEDAPVIRRAILTTSGNATPAQPSSPPKEVAATIIPPAPPVTAEAPAPAARVSATGQPPPSAQQVPAPPAPASAVAELDGVTVRHAIVMTQEEINETLRSQAKARKRTSRRR
ncbi:hypothetical protein [Prosthecobacter fluviatilis]|uniref:Protein kinase domain-containing protein n=1 Tax=Prosthecobacter fluviatilis TaxID=445931 RepID=A0ABW0KJH0_9BACT